MTNKFYITTPIYYVNDIPHIGHSYTTIAADVLARYKRMLGFEVFFLTGTDEHGQKIDEAAKKLGRTPQEHVDETVKGFKAAWKLLEIENDDFIRTTEERHIKVVQEVFRILKEKGDIYKGQYEGWYCTPCETFWTETQVAPKHLCPTCSRAVEKLKEETYFLKLSKYQDRLLQAIESGEMKIEPQSRKNEVLQFIKQGLKDLSVTRTTFSWGVPLPDDPKHVVYVWFDALINYISAIGYLDNKAKFNKYWPADVHVMGKEIVRFHAIIWPCMLFGLGLALPKKVFGHGWWTVEGQKMSKTTGNVVDPIALGKEFGVDAVRYFILREVPFGVDGDFSRANLIHRFNADLANDIGNLLHRSLSMCEKYFDGTVPEVKDPQFDDLSRDLWKAIEELPKKIEDCMQRLAFSDALSEIWKLINIGNNYIEKEAPWTKNKEGKVEELKTVIYNTVAILDTVAFFVTPFMPQTAEKMRIQLNLPQKTLDQVGKKIAGTQVKKGQPLFPRLEK